MGTRKAQSAAASEGASPKPWSVLGDPHTRARSSNLTEASLRAPWAEPPRASTSSRARSRESMEITVGLF